MKHWLIHLFVDNFFFIKKKEVFEKRRNSLYRWQVTVIFYTFTLLTTPFGRSIPTICIFSNPFFIPYEHELSSCEMGAIDRSDGRVCIIYYWLHS